MFEKKFTAVTDHEPLKHFHTAKQPDLRFNRLKAALIGYDFNVVYRSGERNANADALLRNPVIRENEENPELPRVELFNLADKQLEIEPDEEAGTPPGRIFITRAMKKHGIDRHKKLKRHSSDSESSGDDRPPKRDYKDKTRLFEKDKVIAVRNKVDDFYLCHVSILTSTVLKRSKKKTYFLHKNKRQRIFTILKESIEFCKQNQQEPALRTTSQRANRHPKPRAILTQTSRLS